MQVINQVCDTNGICIYFIDSEPGDMTHYSYLMAHQVRSDVYRFLPRENNFNYPTEIDFWDTEDVKYLAEKYDCNPSTVQECINAINAIRE